MKHTLRVEQLVALFFYWPQKFSRCCHCIEGESSSCRRQKILKNTMNFTTNSNQQRFGHRM